MGKRSHLRAVLSSSFKSGARSAKKATLATSAFDVIRARPHHAPLNAAQRGTVKAQAASNERSIARRRDALLVELSQRETQNAFVDRRIGEADGTRGGGGEGGEGGATDAERSAAMAARFVRERVRRIREAADYSVEDAAAEKEELTHAGQALSTVTFAPPAREDDGTDGDRHAGRIDADDVRALHFGGGEGPYALRAAMGRGGAAVEAGAQRSKKEVMDEIILKSKAYRAEKAEESAAQAQRVSGLDAEFASVRAILDYRRGRTDGAERLAAPSNAGTTAQHEDEEDDFMQQAHLLAEEARVKAAERARTAEERAQEEKERLERLESARLRRMRGEEEGGEESDDAASAGVGSRRKRRREREKRERREESEQRRVNTERALAQPAPTDDDLVDNFFVDKDTHRRQLQQQQQEQEEQEEEDNQEDNRGSGEQHQRTRPPQADGARDDSDDSADDSDESAADAGPAASSEGAGGHSSASVDSVPYVFPSPTSHPHLLSLLAPYPASLHPLVYRRIHAYHFPALTADNRGRMESFLTALLTHFHHLCRRHPPAAPFVPLLAHLDALTSVLSDLVQLAPSHAGAASRQLLSTLSTSTSSAADVLLAKLLLDVFPSSDARHNVLTPLLLHLAATLIFAPQRCAGDVARALFTCQLLLHATQQSRRFVPELLNTLHGLLTRGWGIAHADGRLPASGTSMWRRADWASVEDSADWRVELRTIFAPAEADSGSGATSAAAAGSLLALTLRLLSRAARLYAHLPSYPELFAPFHAALQCVGRLTEAALLPASLSALLRSTQSALAQALSAPRPSFALPSTPSTIRLHTPAYIEGYQPGRDYDPIRERAELRELGRKLRREKRGAEKELRKDADFVRAEEARTREARERDAREQRRANYRDMEAQARDSNLLHKKSKKKDKHSSSSGSNSAARPER